LILELAKRISLVSMPWNNVTRPSIQIGVLRSVAEAAGWHSDSHYAYLDFYASARRMLGLAAADWADLYESVSERLYHLSVGDWIFTRRHADAEDRTAFYDLLRSRRIDENVIELIDRLRAVAEQHVTDVTGKLLAARPSAVGFTTTFSQNGPTLAVAERLREEGFTGAIVLGGSNCEGPMGRALLRNYPAVDAIVDGPGEDALEALLAQVEQGAGQIVSTGRLIGRRTPETTPETTVPHQPGATRTLTVPGPNYDGYFEQLHAADLGELAPEVSLPVEFSRGCWWGEKTHCTFCGLNGANMGYRSKNPDAIADELDRLMRRYGVLDFFAVDNILDKGHIQSALPLLEALGTDHSLFFEVKANMEWADLRRLRRAGIRSVQPGIESLSTDALRALRKGSTAFQNLRFLLGCTEYGIQADWNILTGYPGETPESIQAQLDLVASVTHLKPPHITLTRFDRFSPYFESAQAYQIQLSEPFPGYRFAFPELSPEDIWDVAYHFEGDFVDDPRNEELRRRLAARVRIWRSRHEQARLSYRFGFDCVVLTDQRPGLPESVTTFTGDEADLFRAIVGGARLRDLRKQDWRHGWDAVLATLRTWQRRRWVFVEKNKVLALAVREQPSAYRTPPATDAEKRERALLPLSVVSAS
jgi:ribosomal peptide maturation radical SAM protein 1